MPAPRSPRIKINGRPEGTLADFLAANADAISPDEAADIADTLARGETYSGGGSAGRAWTVAPLVVRPVRRAA